MLNIFAFTFYQPSITVFEILVKNITKLQFTDNNSVIKSHVTTSIHIILKGDFLIVIMTLICAREDFFREFLSNFLFLTMTTILVGGRDHCTQF